MPDALNRRAHNPRNLDMIATGLRTVGAARSIVIDENFVVLAGNGVAAAAPAAGITKLRVIEARGDELIAVRRVGLTNEQKRLLAMYDNRAAELATWNVEQLATDLRNGEDLTPFFFTEELNALIPDAVSPSSGLTDPDSVPPERPTDIAGGDIFELGQHRLMCGDSTNASDVAAVLAGSEPTLMVTDPPYGVEYDPTWRTRAGINRNPHKQGAVANDHTADWRAAFALFPGSAAYVWHAGLKSSVVEAALVATGFALRAQLIWAKDRLALSRGDYHWQHEPCWYAVRPGASAHRTDDRTQTTLWSIPARDDPGHGHGTQKPVECMGRPMRNHDAPCVYDPFCGSGTTLIAAEQLRRRVLALEIEPRYVQIAVDRWQAFTGRLATRVDRISTPTACATTPSAATKRRRRSREGRGPHRSPELR